MDPVYQVYQKGQGLTVYQKPATVRPMSTPLEAWALAALQSLTVYHEDVGSPEKPAQLEMIARSVTEAAREQKGWPLSRQRLAAAAIAIGENETHWSLRIHRNECNLKKGECDGGRAISEFQLHANALTAPEVWPTLGFMTFESTKLSAKEASRIFVRSYLYCVSTKSDGDRIAMAFSAYAGRSCQLDKWIGWKARVATYERVLRVPVPKVSAANDSQKQAG
jgi:hypothetical protein